MSGLLARNFLPEDSDHKGYEVVIPSDLLHFDSFHDILLASITGLLAQNQTSRLHVAVRLFYIPLAPSAC